MDDKIVSNEEAYACTTTTRQIGPCGRSILHINKVNTEEGDDLVRYGEQVRFVTNPYIFYKPLYLNSTQCTPQVFARFSRNQEVCLNSQCLYNTVWKILPADGESSTLIGEPVQANTELIIEHCSTKAFLANDNINYGNQFGMECEVSAKRYAVNHKAQQLASETIGKKTIDFSQKRINNQNIWQILTAKDPAAAEPIEAPEKVSYEPEVLLNQIRAALARKGLHTIRALAKIFKSADDNKDR
mmetsp:Transcript_17697/g.29929  ORF Transcript_17697/g.29929 Transcript_17697/m.29929 type:complete len:243 (+) Transcript_17697:295-1023(+)